MKQVLVCSPKYFDVIYDINPWMSSQIKKVNHSLAVAQWQALVDQLERLTNVKILEGVENLPDLVFTANAGFVQNHTAVLSKFSKLERQPEEVHFSKWFSDQTYHVVQPTYSYEGEGDHLVDSHSRHWVGTGFRTDARAKTQLEQFLNTEINLLELVDPRWYHLDTCFCPLSHGELLWYPAAFSLHSQQTIRNSFNKTIEVSTEDALCFSCNAVCIADHVLVPANHAVSKNLTQLGYSVSEFDLSQFLKAGGAAKCLVLSLEKN